MKNTFHCLAFALSVSFMALANAEMKPAQMQLAKLALSTEAVRLPDLNTDCPEVDFPNRFWRIESKLDELQTQLQDKDTCVKAFIAATNDNNLRAFLDKRYPFATGSQISELLQTWSAIFAPARKQKEDDLTEDQDKLRMLRRPFELLNASEKILTRAFDTCPTPHYEPWSSISAAREFQEQYQVYEGCMQAERSTLIEMTSKDFVEFSARKENEFVQTILLLEFNTMASRVAASAISRLSKYTKQRLATQDYIRSNSKQ